MWDLSAQLAELKDEAEPGPSQARINKLPARHVHTHGGEGFALDWSPAAQGRLASGDCRARVHVWEPTPGGRWAVGAGLKGHEGSVEDIQWSPTEGTVFASGSVDKTIRVWDTREPVRQGRGRGGAGEGSCSRAPRAAGGGWRRTRCCLGAHGLRADRRPSAPTPPPPPPPPGP